MPPMPPGMPPGAGRLLLGPLGDHRFGGAGKRIPPDVKEGDTILFGKWSGSEVKIDGDELLIMKESDIMGIIEKPGAASKAA